MEKQVKHNMKWYRKLCCFQGVTHYNQVLNVHRNSLPPCALFFLFWLTSRPSIWGVGRGIVSCCRDDDITTRTSLRWHHITTVTSELWHPKCLNCIKTVTSQRCLTNVKLHHNWDFRPLTLPPGLWHHNLDITTVTLPSGLWHHNWEITTDIAIWTVTSQLWHRNCGIGRAVTSRMVYSALFEARHQRQGQGLHWEHGVRGQRSEVRQIIQPCQ